MSPSPGTTKVRRTSRNKTYVAFQSALEDELLSHIVKSLSRQSRGSMVEVEREFSQVPL